MTRFDSALTVMNWGKPERVLEQYYATVKYVYPCPFCKGDITYEGYLERETGYYDEQYFFIEVDGHACPHCQKKIFCKIQVH
jgi:hypothetical protein